jgi:predicted membrane protein
VEFIFNLCEFFIVWFLDSFYLLQIVVQIFYFLVCLKLNCQIVEDKKQDALLDKLEKYVNEENRCLQIILAVVRKPISVINNYCDQTQSQENKRDKINSHFSYI